MHLNSIQQVNFLSSEFSKPGKLWGTFYKSFSRFKSAVDGTINSILLSPSNSTIPPLPPIAPRPPRQLTKLEREQIKKRDGNACLSCEASGKGVMLEIDHIIPVSSGGETTLENSQTLCSICNGSRYKGVNEINFRFNATQLRQPKLINLFLSHKGQDAKRVITRTVNFFYHCKAVYRVNLHKKTNGKYYSVWEIHLYSGNNPEWLLSHKAELLKFVQHELRYSHVQDIKVTGGS